MELFLNFEDHPPGLKGPNGLCEQPAADLSPSHNGGVIFSINGKVNTRVEEWACPGAALRAPNPEAGHLGEEAGSHAARAPSVWRNLLIPWHYHASRTCELPACEVEWASRKPHLFGRYTYHALGYAQATTAGDPAVGCSRLQSGSCGWDVVWYSHDPAVDRLQ